MLLFFQNWTDEIKRLYQNMSFLFILQIANYILPLITFPYLVRTIGIENVGLIALAEAFNQYFIIFTSFGFDFSATYDVSVYRNNKEKLEEIFNSVLLIKLVLTSVCFIILVGILFCIYRTADECLLYILSFGMVLGSAIFPVWFFQGIEKMKYITVINMGTKFLTTVFIFSFIRTPNDFILVPLLNSLGIIISGVIAIRFVVKTFKLTLFIPSYTSVKKTIRGSIDFFLSRLFASSYNSVNKIVIGIVLDTQQVGYYTMAEKIFQAWQGIYTPLSNSLYPYMAKSKNIVLFKKIFIRIITFNMIISLVVYIYSDTIIKIVYSNNFTIATELLGLFSILSIVAIPSLFLGYPLLAAMGHPKSANYSVILGAVIHIILLLYIIPSLSVYKVMFLMIATNCIVVAIRLYALKRYKLV